MSTLFEPGAPAPKDFIPLCVPEIRGREWQYIKECLDAGWVSSAGSFVDRFERDVASYVGAQHAVATVNGTAALHIALVVAGVQPDDEVLMPTLTFIAPANAVRYIGAWPVFIDAEPDHWQMDMQKAARFLEDECRWVEGALMNRATGRRVKAIMPVHILGHSVDMDPLQELAQQYNLVVIEDATESLGAKYKDRMVGALGHIGCFSFNGNKIITAGGGGMIVTENESWARKARYLVTQAKDDPVEYVHAEIGYNYRLTNIQAAMGVAQMEQLEDYKAAKRRTAAAYIEAFRELPGVTPMRQAAWASSIWWMFTVLIDEQRYGLNSRALLDYLSRHRIQARPLWQPLHRSPAHQHLSSPGPATSFEVADRIQRDALTLPCSVGLTEHERATVIEAVRAAHIQN